MDRRVVITGMGAITPVGNTAEESWGALVAGKNGIGTITAFDTTGFRVTVAAEVKDFDPVSALGKPDTLHNDRNVQFALVASDEAMKSSGLDAEGAIDPERLGDPDYCRRHNLDLDALYHDDERIRVIAEDIF